MQQKDIDYFLLLMLKFVFWALILMFNNNNKNNILINIKLLKKIPIDKI
jgi:hypothetical protein